MLTSVALANAVKTQIAGSVPEVDTTTHLIDNVKATLEGHQRMGMQLARDTWPIVFSGSCHPRVSPNVFAGDAKAALASAKMSQHHDHPVSLTSAASVQHGCVSTTFVHRTYVQMLLAETKP